MHRIIEIVALCSSVDSEPVTSPIASKLLEIKVSRRLAW